MTDTTNPNREQARVTLDVFLAAYSDRADAELVNRVPDDDLLTFGDLRTILAALPTPEAERVEGRGHVNIHDEAMAMFAHLNCPTCNGSGHIEDARLTNDPAGSAGESGEAATEAAYRAIYGPDMDPFQHPEGWSYAATVANAVAATLHPTQDSRDVAGAEAIEAAAKRIAVEVGAEWPQDANRYRRIARAALDLHTTEGEAK